MTDEIFLDGVRYISAGEAARECGVTNNYITQFCRQGKMRAQRVGKNWYVEIEAARHFFAERERALEEKRETLKKTRADEYQVFKAQGSGAYITTAEAASEFGVTPDYVTQFCRQGKINARQIKNVWHVERKSAGEFFLAHTYRVAARKQHIKQIRTQEKELSQQNTPRSISAPASLLHAHTPLYTLTPAVGFAHKLIALALALTLTFGTFAAVDPSYASYVAQSVRSGLDSLARINTLTLVKREVAATKASFDAVVANPASVLVGFTSAVGSLARSVNAPIDSLLYALAFPHSVGSSLATVAVQITPPTSGPLVGKKPTPRIAIAVSSPTPNSKSQAQSSSGDGSTTINNYPVVERVVQTERVISDGALTPEFLDRRLNELDNKLSSHMYSLSSANSTYTGQIYNVVAQTNAINQLDHVAITNPTFTGGSISGASVSATLLSVSGGATLVNATTSALFSTTASSTNLFSQTASLGSLSLSSTLGITGLATFTNGFLSLASSTVTSGLFSMNGGASTTNFTVSGNAYFPGSGIWTSSGNVGIGTTTPNTSLVIESSTTVGSGNASLLIEGNSNTERVELRSAGATPGPAFQGRGWGGTIASPTATQSGMDIFILGGSGFDGTNIVTVNSSVIKMTASENWTSTANGSYIHLDTTPNGLTTASRAERLRITGDGNVGIGTTTPAAMFAVAGSGYLAGSLTLLPQAGALQKGIAVTQSASGIPTQDVGLDAGWNFNQINVTDTGVDASGFAEGSQTVNGLDVAYTSNGSKGIGIAILGTIHVTGSPAQTSNTLNQFIAGQFIGQAGANMGGTGGSPVGAIFGLGATPVAASGATFLLNVSNELNIQVHSGASTKSKSILSLAGGGTSDAVQGSTYDTELSLSNIAGSVGFQNGILFSDYNGQHPVTSTGTLIATQGSYTTLNGIDLSSYTFTGNAFKSNNFLVDGSGRVGIGTTSPTNRLEVAGNTFLGGNLTATGTLAVAGNATFSGTLTVNGLCVAADTKLRRRRKNAKGEYEYDEPEIIDIEEGDEIQSLDEKTGRLVWSRVNALMYMGVKQTSRITTEDGRSIRTTAAHPYLVQKIGGRVPRHKSLIDEAGWLAVSDLKMGDSIAAPRLRGAAEVAKPRLGVFIDGSNLFYSERRAGWGVDYARLREFLSAEFDLKFINYYTAMPKEGDEPARQKKQNYLSKIRKHVRVLIKPLKYLATRIVTEGLTIEGVDHKGDCDVEITVDVMNALDGLDAIVVFSGDSDFVALRKDVLRKGKKICFVAHRHNLAIELKKGKHVTLNSLRAYIEYTGGQKKTPATRGGTSVRPSIVALFGMSSGGGVPVDSEISWLKIKSIEAVAEEDVYDVEVEGTHNFIGNGIVAHNTAIFNQASSTMFTNSGATWLTGAGLSDALLATDGSGKVVATSTPTANNFIATSQTAASSLPYASTTAFTVSGNAYFPGSGIWNSSGAVGIGTTTPQNPLSVIGQIQSDKSTFPGLLLSVNGAAKSTLFWDTTNNVLQLGSGALNNGISVQTSTGNVGIGTTSPQSQLHVWGAGQTTAALTDSGNTGGMLTLSDTGLAAGNGGALAFSAFGSDKRFAAIKGFLTNGNSNTAGDLAFSTRSAISDTALTERMRIAGDGNIGVGTTTPIYQLDIDASKGPSVTSPGIRVGDFSAGQSYVVPIEAISSRADGNTTFEGRLAASYRRTDGTAIPSGAAIGGVMFGGQWGTDTSFQSSKLLYPASIKGVAEGSFTSASAMSTGLAFSTGSTGDDLRSANLGYGTERMRIDSGGKVGINRTTQLAQLEIKNSTAYSTPTLGTGTGVLGLIGYDGLYGTYIGISGTGDTWFQSQRNDANTAAYNLLFNPSGGNVGIGVTSPLAGLHVAAGTLGGPNTSGTTADSMLKISNPATSGAGMDFGVAYLASPIYSWIQSREMTNHGINYNLAINPNGGAVGIGMNPSNILDITQNQNAPSVIKVLNSNGSSAADSALYLSNGTSLGIVQQAGTGWNSAFFSGGPTTAEQMNVGTQAAGPLIFGTSNSARMTIDSSGFVGIGTTTPQHKLSVEGGSATSIMVGNTSSTGYAGYRIYNDTYGNSRTMEIDYSGSAYASSLLSSGVTGEAGSIATTGAYPLMFGTTNTLRMIIGSAGSVAIGNTQLNQKFSVTGASGESSGAGTSGILAITTGTGLNTDNKIEMGIVDDSYGWLNVIHPGSAQLPLSLNPGGGTVGIGTTSPAGLLHVDAASSIVVLTSADAGSTETTDAKGVIFRSGSYRMGEFASRLVKSDEGGGIPLYIQTNESGNKTTWVNAARFGPYTGNSNKFETFGQTALATASGLVGIGTTTPVGSLHIVSSTNQFNSIQDGIALGKSSSGDYQIQLTNPAGGNPHIDFTNGTNEDYDMRLILAGDDQLNVDGGNLVVLGTGTTCTIGNGTGATNCTSDSRLKANIASISGTSALAGLSKIRGVTFNWADPSKDQGEQVGVIAQDVLQAFPQIVHTATTTFMGQLGNYYTVDYAALVSPLISGVNQLNTRTGFIESAYGASSTPAFYVDAAGNVGIGTSTASAFPYKLNVAGSVAAEDFINISTRGSKTDITPLEAVPRQGLGTSEDDILGKINDTTLFSYRYKDENTSAPLRIGLITDSAPSEVLSPDGGGVDIYKLAAFTFAGLKAEDRKVAALALRVDSLESAMAVLPRPGLGNGDIDLFVGIREWFANAANGITKFFAGEVRTNKLCLDDVCVTKEQLQAMLAATGVAAASSTPSESESPSSPSSPLGPPVLEVQGNNPATIQVGDSYNDLGALITGPTQAEMNLGIQVVVDGGATTTPDMIQIDTSVEGTHSIVYSATTQGGLTGYAERTVVVETPAPASPPADESANPDTRDSGETATSTIP